MMKVFLKFYDKVNLGDDLFVKVIADRYKDNISVISNNSEHLKSIVTVLPRKQGITRLLLRAKQVLFRINNLSMVAEANKSDILLYAGGSVFIEKEGLSTWYREARFYKSLNVPYYILGANIGPYKTSDFLLIIKSILGGARDVCLRDSASYGLAKDLPNVRLASDMVFSLDTSPYEVVNERIAIFSIIDGKQKFDGETADKYNHEIRQMTLRLIKDGYRVVYMSFCEYEGDERANNTLIGQLPLSARSKVEMFNYRGDLTGALQLIASCEIILASRFHAMILGLVFGKKVLPMAYSDKTTDILMDMGFEGQVVDIRKIQFFDSSLVDFYSIPVLDVTRQSRLAEEQFLMLDKVLSRKKEPHV